MPADRSPATTRRSLLQTASIAGALPGAVGALSLHEFRGRESPDGIPRSIATSASVHRTFAERYGSRFDGIEPDRRDLLLDVRHVGHTTVPGSAIDRLISLFRSNGIHAQWLEYPERYDQKWFESTYGDDVRKILWARESFYRTAIEERLRDIALQVIVVPEVTDPPDDGSLYSPMLDATGGGTGGRVNGFSVGNRLVVAERETSRAATRLLLHEIGHLALCHDDDPANDGVMGRADRIDLLAEEWATLRDNLDNVRDDYGVLQRPCLWRETLTGLDR